MQYNHKTRHTMKNKLLRTIIILSVVELIVGIFAFNGYAWAVKACMVLLVAGAGLALISSAFLIIDKIGERDEEDNYEIFNNIA